MAEAVQEALELAAGNVEKLANEVGVGAHAVWAWRRGDRVPGPENRAKLADVLEARGGRLGELAEILRGDD